MKKRILGCLTMLCVISVILTGCRNQRQGAADLQNRESSSLAMAEENAMNREVGAQDPGDPQGTGDSQGTGGSQDSEDAVRTAGKAEAGNVRAEDDYYNYVNQKILAEKQIPADSGNWSYFYELGQKSYDNLSDLLNEIINQREQFAEGSPEQKIASLYLTAIDMEGRRNAGFGALQPYLDSIRNAADIQEYIEAIGTINNELGFSSLIAPTYYEDMKDSRNYGCYLGSADLGPGKETLEDGTQSAILEAYRKYIKNIMESTGISEKEAERAASTIYKFQTDLASATLPLSDQNDPEKTYNPKSLKELSALYSNIDIKAYLKAAGAAGFNSWVVNDPGQAKKVNSYLTEGHLPLLKDYSVFCLIKDFSPCLTPEIRDSTIAWSNAQKGIQGKKTDKKLAGELVQNTFGFEFGRLYVEKHFSEEDKKNVETLVHQILAAYEDRINGLDWMGEATKEKAIRKLEHMTLKIGYPDHWPDYYENAVILPEGQGSLVDNMVNVYRSLRSYEKEEIKKPVDRTQWGMTPQTVNAYYNPLNNEIVFPAAILQPPFYDPNADDASNLGGIGMVIAHEISHAFDSSGARYDENGNYNMWWTEDDLKKFQDLTLKVAAYYDGQEAVKGRYVNGRQTLNENIADLGALACVTSIAGDDTEALNSLFTQYARIWASKYTEESMIHRLNTDVHSPAKVRVNAVLSSTEAFYKVYPDLKEGDGMYAAPEKRVKIW